MCGEKAALSAALEVMIFDNLPHHAIEVKLCKRLEESCEPVSLTESVSLTEYVATIILC